MPIDPETPTIRKDGAPASQGRSAGHPAAPSVRTPLESLHLMPGQIIGGRYELIGALGVGGMAEVWRAIHIPLRTEVAVKFVSARIAYDERVGPESMERFRFEAQISARLGARSRHIVAVHDADMHQGRPYLVMELVEGRSLGDWIDEGPLSPAQVAGVVEQVAEALDAAHAAGVLHRDLKPTNVLLAGERGGSFTAKVADFGIAKLVKGDLAVDRPKTTMVGAFVGTPAYMSPEQVTARVDVDHRSDLWALGVLAYEALTGQLPFEGPSYTAVMAAIGIGRFDAPSQRRPDLTPALDAWFKRALAYDREDRFSSAGEMAAALRAALGQPAAQRQPPTVQQLPAFGHTLLSQQPTASQQPGPRRRAALIAGVALVALLLLGVGLFAIRGLHGAEATLPEPAPVTAPVTASAPEVAPAPVTAPAPVPVVAPAPEVASASASAPAAATAPAPPTTRPRKRFDPSETQ